MMGISMMVVVLPMVIGMKMKPTKSWQDSTCFGMPVMMAASFGFAFAIACAGVKILGVYFLNDLLREGVSCFCIWLRSCCFRFAKAMCKCKNIFCGGENRPTTLDSSCGVICPSFASVRKL